MAAYAAQGAAVTLVTCTRGELGEIIPPELADLAGGAGGGAPWRVAKLYATAMPRSVLARAIRLGPDAPARFTPAGTVADLPFGVADEQVTTEVDGTGQRAAKVAALRSHATQIAVEDPYFALSDIVGRPLGPRAHYT